MRGCKSLSPHTRQNYFKTFYVHSKGTLSSFCFINHNLSVAQLKQLILLYFCLRNAKIKLPLAAFIAI